jgi:hypothetical protein
LRAVLLALALLMVALPAAADVQRFAVLVGNNRGSTNDPDLRYAESDADKLDAVLRELGGVSPANVTVLRGENADTVRKTLVAVNDRIRATSSLPDTQTLLFVYFSGHADAAALHLGATRFELNELAQLVRGSAATFRLLVLDACRSGSLTRVKGGVQVPPFALPPDPSLRGEGLAFLTASSAMEDAQESDEIRGSFFTHALVSGLLGAADRDGDGAVALDEAYRYAYDATLRATSRTFAGAQHPTFHYDFRGQDALVLTRLKASPTRAALAFPPDVGFLILRDGAEGAVVAELGARGPARRLSLRPGRYFVRGRGKDVLYEGAVALAEREERTLDVGELRRVEYARLVRKGARESGVSHGPELGVSARTELPNAAAPCLGFAGGYRVEFEHLSAVARVGVCRSGFDNAFVSATTDELDGSLAAFHAWDFGPLSLGAGLGFGAALFHQRFETVGSAPGRSTVSPFVLAVAAATVDVSPSAFVAVDGRAETYFMRTEHEARQTPRTEAAFTVRATLMGGVHF